MTIHDIINNINNILLLVNSTMLVIMSYRCNGLSSDLEVSMRINQFFAEQQIKEKDKTSEN